MMMMTRDEHLTWCKQRALEYVDAGDTANALASIFSDLRKHEEAKDHPAIELGALMLFGGHLKTVSEMRKFIEGFN